MSDEGASRENFDSIYELLSNGEFDKANEIIEVSLKSLYNSKFVLSAMKSVLYWKKVKSEISSFKGPSSKGLYLIEKWKTFIEHFDDVEIYFQEGLIGLKKWVFNTALFDFLETKENSKKSYDAYNPLVDMQIGRCLKILGDYKNAIVYLKKAYNYERKNGEIIAEMADCLALSGNTVFSKTYFAEAFFQNPDAVRLEFIETSYIKRLEEKLINEYNVKENLINYWIPVYASILKVFNIKRELEPMELRELDLKMVELKRDLKSNIKEIKPKLIYCYIRLINHLLATKDLANRQEKISIALNEIKLLDSKIYKEYIK